MEVRMKSLMSLWQVFAADCGKECSVSTIRDSETVAKRVEHEGPSFLSMSLPQFCKDFEKSLSTGCVDRSSFQGYTWRGGLPAFLGGFLDLVFSRFDGRLVDGPNVAAIHSVRQLTLLFGKVEAEASARRRRAAIEGYVDCEKEVRRCDDARSELVVKEFESVSRVLYGELFSGVDSALLREHKGWDGSSPDWPYIHPKHGPGATADRLGGNAKFDLSEWPSRLEEVFRYGEYGIPNWRYFDRYATVNFLEPGHERAAKLVDVPKTPRTPRLIAKEPTAMQYMQQAVQGLLVTSIKRDRYVGGMIGFDDQEANHQLARIGSISGAYATLDLSEASDRVSYSIVGTLLNRWPHIAEAVDATRSRYVEVPGYGKLPLAKFASMGSALTFPVEALVFLTAVFMGVERVLNRPLTRRDVLHLRGQVRVYGDDIIVPTQYALSVRESLEDLGLKVNTNKSFWSGNFRESCGREYYAGHDVSVVRVRHVTINPDGTWALPTRRQDVVQTESLVSLRNRCYAGGRWEVAKWLDGRIENLLGGRYPTVVATQAAPGEELFARSEGLVRWSILGYQTDCTDKDTQAPVVRCWKRVFSVPESSLGEEGALTKVLLAGSAKPDAKDTLAWMFGLEESNQLEEGHLQYAGRPTKSTLERRQASPF